MDYRTEVKTWLAQFPDGVTKEELLGRFPRCPLTAMEQTGHIKLINGRYFKGDA